MQNVVKSLGVVATLLIAGCATGFVSTWKAPDAKPLQLAGAKVAAIVMVDDISLMRAAEDALAQAITENGATGVALYTIVPDASADNEAEVQSALEKGGFAGVVTMRPAAVDQEVVSTPVTFVGPSYDYFWGGYYDFGWNHSYAIGGDIRTNTILTIETLVYSLNQNKLVWGGQSKSKNPSNVERVIKQTADKVVAQLEEEGLLP